MADIYEEDAFEVEIPAEFFDIDFRLEDELCGLGVGIEIDYYAVSG